MVLDDLINDSNRANNRHFGDSGYVSEWPSF